MKHIELVGLNVSNFMSFDHRGVDLSFGSLGSKKVFVIGSNDDSPGLSSNGAGKCLVGSTLIPLVNGEMKSIEELVGEKNPFWVYSYDPMLNRIVPGKATAKKTRALSKLVEVFVDSGESVKCSPDHPFKLRGGLFYKKAGDLSPGDKLLPFYRRMKRVRKDIDSLYEQLYQFDTEKYEFTHRCFVSGVKSMGSEIVHHKNFNHFDNCTENLIWVDLDKHRKMHGGIMKIPWVKEKHALVLGSKKVRDKISVASRRNWADPSYRAKVIAAVTGRKGPMTGKHHTDSTKERISKSCIKYSWIRGLTKETDSRVMAIASKIKGRIFSFSTRRKMREACREKIKRGWVPWNKGRRGSIPWNKGRRGSIVSEGILNHTVLRVEVLETHEDCYDLFVEKYHNFAIGSGVFVHNSSLFDALCWGLFMDTPRLSDVEDVLRREGDKKFSAEVQVFFDVISEKGNKSAFKVVARRTPSKAEMELFQYEKMSYKNWSWAPYGGLSGLTEVKNEVRRILGIDYPTFLNICYLGGDVIKSFISGSVKPAERIAMLSKMLSLDIYDSCLKVVQDQRKLVRDQLLSAKGELEGIWDVDDGTIPKESEISALRVKLKKANEDLAEGLKAVSVVGDYLNLSEYLRDLKAKADEALEDFRGDWGKVSGELEELVSVSPRDLASYSKRIGELQTKLEETNKSIGNLVSDKNLIQGRVEGMEEQSERLTKLKELKVANCPTCGTPLGKDKMEHVAKELESIQGKVKLFKRQLSSIYEKISKDNLVKQDLEVDIKNFQSLEEARIERETTKASRACRLKDSLSSLEKQAEKTKADSVKEEERIKAKISKLDLQSVVKEYPCDLGRAPDYLEEVQGHVEESRHDIQTLSEKIGSLENRLETYKKAMERKKVLKKEVEKLTILLSDLDFWADGFGIYGIRSEIIQSFLPMFETQINSYLTGWNIPFSVRVETEKKKKSGGEGEYIDGFYVDVVDRVSGRTQPWDNYSRGERTRIGVAQALAMRDLVAQLGGVDVRFVMFDEIFDSLDQVGVSQFVELLDKVDGLKMVVSHNSDMAKLFRDVISVRKSGGVSVAELVGRN